MPKSHAPPRISGWFQEKLLRPTNTPKPGDVDRAFQPRSLRPAEILGHVVADRPMHAPVCGIKVLIARMSVSRTLLRSATNSTRRQIGTPAFLPRDSTARPST